MKSAFRQTSRRRVASLRREEVAWLEQADVDVLSPVLWNVRDLRDLQTRSVHLFKTVNFHVPEAAGQTAIFLYPVDEGGTAAH